MAIFQKSVVNKFLKHLDNKKVVLAFEQFQKFYGDKLRLFDILHLKEENYQEGFLREIFVQCLGYTIRPDVNYNLTTEYQNATDNKKADGAILRNHTAIGVIELKSTKTFNLDTIKNQAFNYKNNQPDCRYVITSNFHYLRFYIDNATEYEEFDLFEMANSADEINSVSTEFKKFYLILSQQSLFNDIPLKMKAETQFHEESISEKFYKDYKQFRDKIFENLIKNNPEYDKLTLFKKTQKLLDRFIFIWFAEDCGLVAPNLIAGVIQKWKTLLDSDEYFSLYSRFQKTFKYLDTGYTFQKSIYPAFNGGLFHHDDIIDNPNLKIDDDVLIDDCLKISAYDFSTDLDVNILGHIFEHSLNEIEEISAELKGENLDKTKTKRKRDGIFYTPQYVTNYIVQSTLGKLCIQKQKELQIENLEGIEKLDRKGKITKEGKELFQKLKSYKDWLLTLKIIDPACGSGAFLNAALDFLINEHSEIDNQICDLTGDKMRIFDTDKTILENNIFGVDINEESVEIAKLSLWLRTARKDRKLSDLNGNIKCGNSLIDSTEIAGKKAFDWKKEFPEIMKKGGFDIVIGNPPYGVKFSETDKKYLTKFDNLVPDFEIYIYFVSLAMKYILNKTGILSYIIPNTFLSILYGVKYRKYILDNHFVSYISDLSNDLTFVDASVRTCIVSIAKQDLNLGTTDIVSINAQTKAFELSKQIDKTHLYANIENWLNLSKTTSQSDEIVKKIKKHQPLSAFFEVSQGYIPYRRSDLIKQFGEEKGNKIVNERLWHSNFRLSDDYKQEILGKDIGRYKCSESKSFIKYGKHVASFVPIKFFNQPRILIREITNSRLFCCYIEKELYNNPSIINIISSSENKIQLKFLLAILNSSLIGWYHNQTSPKAQKGLFPKILINDVRNLPISEIENQSEFVLKVDKMIDLNAQIQQKQNDFVELLLSNFKIHKITSKISNFFAFDFKELLLELKKQKVEINLKQQLEWKNLFKEIQNEINDFNTQKNLIDREIDRLVCDLYQLTEEEIQIIENFVNIKE